MDSRYNVSAYSINTTIGEFSAATGSPFTASTTPFSVTTTGVLE